MPSIDVFKVLVRENVTSERVPRTTEPDLVMDDPEKVAAYTRAGREDGVMAPVYLHHCTHICQVLKPGDVAVDLACGPATQLAQVARLNPDVRFIGVDLSEPMLERARDHIKQLGLTNVEFRVGDISTLTAIEDQSADAVFTTMALHHLPTLDHLCATFAQVDRVLRPGGGIFLVDFARLKSAKSIDYFAYQYADRQPELFTLDYLYSLHAAFSVADFAQAAKALAGRAHFYRMFGFPYMIAFKSPARRELDEKLLSALRAIRDEMPKYHRADFKDLKTFFGFGGLKAPAGI
jgi:ubiquinone/menaquinone biosynthesis C-methylase UbiE